MKILISCLSFRNLTGSELYVYELARELAKQHDVFIVSPHLGGDLKDCAEKYGINCFNLTSPPNYIMGDGERKYRLDGEERIMENQKFYKISDEYTFDLMLLNHAPVAKVLLDLYDCPALNIIHSEIIPQYESPIVHDNVAGYVAVRQSIKDYLIKEWGISSDKVKVIYNPIDNTKFTPEGESYPFPNNVILFVGTYDYLRKTAIQHLIKYVNKHNMILALMGSGYRVGDNEFGALRDELDVGNVVTIAQTDRPEYFTRGASMVAGVMMGRTTIEGWMCGKPAIIYDIDEKGNIKDVTKYDVPKDLTRYYPENVVKELLEYANSNI